MTDTGSDPTNEPDEDLEALLRRFKSLTNTSQASPMKRNILL